MKHSFFLISMSLFAFTNTAVCIPNAQRTSDALSSLVIQVVENAHNLSEIKQEPDKKKRRAAKVAHIAKIIKAVIHAILEIIAASKDGNISIQFLRAGEIHPSLLQEQVDKQLRMVLADMLVELEDLEDEEASEQSEE